MARKTKADINKEKKKKELKESFEKSLEYNQNVKSIIINIASVVIVLALFYLITSLVTDNKPVLHEKEKTPATIQYDEILAGETFNMPESEYNVLFYDFDGANASYYLTIALAAKTKTYVVDIDNKLNKEYVSDTTNSGVQQISDLKVKEATLIKIKDNSNIFYFEGELASIKEHLD